MKHCFWYLLWVKLSLRHTQIATLGQNSAQATPRLTPNRGSFSLFWWAFLPLLMSYGSPPSLPTPTPIRLPSVFCCKPKYWTEERSWSDPACPHTVALRETNRSLVQGQLTRQDICLQLSHTTCLHIASTVLHSETFWSCLMLLSIKQHLTRFYVFVLQAIVPNRANIKLLLFEPNSYELEVSEDSCYWYISCFFFFVFVVRWPWQCTKYKTL